MSKKFKRMTTAEAIDYCKKFRKKYERDYNNLDGDKRFRCLISILERNCITPSELPNYGMNYGAFENKKNI